MPLFCGDIKICCAFRTFWKTFSRGGGVTKTPCVTSGTLLHKERFHEKVAVLLDFLQITPLLILIITKLQGGLLTGPPLNLLLASN